MYYLFAQICTTKPRDNTQDCPRVKKVLGKSPCITGGAPTATILQVYGKNFTNNYDKSDCFGFARELFGAVNLSN